MDTARPDLIPANKPGNALAGFRRKLGLGDSGPSIWITRERPKIDRIACPWMVRRFIDRDAQFLYAPTQDVLRIARERGAIAYDIPGGAISHEGELCSFDMLMRAFELRDPALEALAVIVRGADTDRHELAPQCAGLLAVSLGLGKMFSDDMKLLEHGMTVYDALYAWCRDGRGETHNWNPGAAA